MRVFTLNDVERLETTAFTLSVEDYLQRSDKQSQCFLFLRDFTFD